jgi:4-aminobutyrate aminotransferase-like enzyme
VALQQRARSEGNVIRVLVPLVISDDDLVEGLAILEESLRAACEDAA